MLKMTSLCRAKNKAELRVVHALTAARLPQRGQPGPSQLPFGADSDEDSRCERQIFATGDRCVHGSCERTGSLAPKCGL